MPAPYARRDWQTKTDRALNRVGRGGNQGRFPGARPVFVTPVGRPSDRVDYRDVGELHYIEGWNITGTTDDTFRTTHEPLPMSWNLELNGVRVHRSEFDITGRVITITDPADLFKGVTTQGSPWDLEIQYDYRDATPFEPALVGATSTQIATTPATINYPADVQVGDLLILTVNGSQNWTGTPTGWTPIANVPLTIGSLSNRHIVAARYSAGETSVAVNWSGTSGKVYTLTAYRNIGSPSVTATASAAVAGATATGPSLSATGPGLLVHSFAFGMNSGVSITAGTGYDVDNYDTNSANFASLVGSEQVGAGATTARTAVGGTSSAVWSVVSMFCESL